MGSAAVGIRAPDRRVVTWGTSLDFQRGGGSTVRVEGIRVARKCFWSERRRTVKEETRFDCGTVSTGAYLGKTTFGGIFSCCW